MPLLAHFPQTTAYRIASLSGRFLTSRHEIDFEAVKNHMRMVFPTHSKQQIEHWANYSLGMIGRDALDTWYFRTLKTPEAVDRFVHLEGFEAIKEARKQGRRVMISSGHFGRFWMAGVGMRAQGVTVGTLTRDGGERNDYGLPEREFRYRLKKLQWLQTCFGGPFLVEGDLVRPIYRALDEHVMALFIDVPYVDEKNGCINVPFLGRPGRFPLGIARIAKKSEALVVPFYVFESRSGLTAKFFPPIEPRELPEEEIMLQLVKLLEQQILASPEQWWLWQALPLIWQ